MILQKVLLAYDGSADSQKASEWLLNFAKQVPVETVVVNVFDSEFENDADSWAKIQDVIEAYRQRMEDALAKVANTFSDNGLPATTAILEGHPASKIIQYAVRESCGSDRMRYAGPGRFRITAAWQRGPPIGDSFICAGPWL